MMISPLTTFGMGSAYVKYFPSLSDSRKLKNQFFTYQFLIIVLANTLIIALSYLNKEWIISLFANGSSEYVNYLTITAIVIIVNSLFEHLFAYSSTLMKVAFPTFLREILLRVGTIVLVLGYAGGYFDFDGAVKGLAVTYTLALVLLFAHLILFHQLRFDFRLNFISKEWKKKIIRFASYSMAVAVSFSVFNNVTYAQITAILGDGATGIFATCFFIGVIVEMPRRNMIRVISPILSTAAEQKDLVLTSKIYKKSSITMTAVGVLLFIGIMTNVNDLFAFIPKGSDFQTGFNVVLAVCAAKLVLMTASFSGEIIHFSSYYRYNLYFQLASALLIIVLNILLLPKYGLNGVAISYFATITLHAMVRMIYVRTKFGIHPFMNSHITLYLLSAVIFLGAYLFSTPFGAVITIIIRSFLTTLLFVFLIYKFKVSEDINNLINSILNRMKMTFK